MIIVSRRERIASAVLTRVALVLMLVWSLAPIVWVAVTAFKNSREVYAFPPSLFPRLPTLSNFEKALFGSPFPTFVMNSLIVALAVTAASVVVGALAAYAIARMQFPGRSMVARGLVVSYLMPPALLFIPLFLVLQSAGLIDSRTGLALAYLSFTVPFCTWMLVGYFRALPREVDEAALVDGASRGRILVEIVLPMALPGLAVVALFAFTHAWNEFLYALVFVFSKESQTFTAGLAGLMMGDSYIWGLLMASSVIAMLPIMIIYFAAQRFIVEGLAAGSVKG